MKNIDNQLYNDYSMRCIGLAYELSEKRKETKMSQYEVALKTGVSVKQYKDSSV
jgi:hypothetical protein